MKTLSIEDRNLDKNVSPIRSGTLMGWASAMDDAIEQSLRLLSEEDRVFVLQERVSYREDEDSLVGKILEPSGESIDVSLFIDKEDENVTFLLSVFDEYDEVSLNDETKVESTIRELIPEILTRLFS